MAKKSIKTKTEKQPEIRITDVSKEMYAEIKRQAESEKRSISKQAEYLLELALGYRDEK